MKKLIILTACFAGLAAFVYFYEISGKEARDQAEELQQSVLRVEQDKIHSVEIDHQGQEPIVLEKVDDNWVLRKPIDALADNGAVDGLLRDLSAAKRDRTLEAVSGDDLKTYGLDDPGIRVKVDAEGGVKTLRVGNKDFSGSKLYVQLEGSKDVLVTSTSLETSVNKPTADWRSKDALKFDRAKVEQIEIHRPAGNLDLQKRDGNWVLTSPEEGAADETKVTSLLSTLEFAKAVRFVEEDPEDRIPVRTRQTSGFRAPARSGLGSLAGTRSRQAGRGELFRPQFRPEPGVHLEKGGLRRSHPGCRKPPGEGRRGRQTGPGVKGADPEG